MPNVKGYSLDEKIETLTNTQRQFEKAKDYSDDKIELAKQTFESVCGFYVVHVTLELFYSTYCTFQMDVNIRKVDSDLARLEIKIKKKSISATRPIGSQKRKCFVKYDIMLKGSVISLCMLFSGGRTNINDKGIKKKSASNDEETVSKTTKNKQLKIGLWATSF